MSRIVIVILIYHRHKPKDLFSSCFKYSCCLFPLYKLRYFHVNKLSDELAW
jgi:hypothetical protein